MEARAYEDINLESKDSDVGSCAGDADFSGVSLVDMLVRRGR
jgi:hypothetical protein